MADLMTRLAKALERDGIVDTGQLDGCKIQRTYAGWSQKTHGAWSFAIVTETGAETYLGSQYPASRLVQERRLLVEHDGSIAPDQERGR